MMTSQRFHSRVHRLITHDFLRRVLGFEETDQLSWRENLSNRLLVIAIIAIPVVFFGSLENLLQKQIYFFIALDAVIWLWAIAALFLKKPPLLVGNSTTLLSLFFLLNVVTHVTFGPDGTRPIWLAMVVALAGAFYGVRMVLFTVFVNLLMLIGFQMWLPASYEPWIASREASSAAVAMVLFSKSALCLILGITVSFLVKRLEDKLQLLEHNQRQYDLLSENLTEVIWTMDIGGWFTFVSPSVFSLRGFTAKEVLAQSPSEAMTPESVAIVDRAFKKSVDKIAAGEPDGWDPIVVELEQTCKDGSTVFTRSSAKLIPGPDGKPAQVIGVTQDFTAQKKVEEEKQELSTRLRQTQKMEAIGLLAGGIAHDFNNILGAILGYTQLAQMSVEKGSKTNQMLEQVMRASTRATELVHQILLFSRQTEQQFKPFELRLVVKEALELLRASLPSTIEVGTDIRKSSFIMGDPSQMHQVLMNLCTNASHAMGKDGGILSIQLLEKNLDSAFVARYPGLSVGRYAFLSVSDTGHGIEKEHLEKIFDPFYTTKAPGQGTGLGLSVVHGIVKSHGGAIIVDSEVSKGTVFKIYLPVVNTQIQKETDAEESQFSGSECILFVDDEITLLNVGQLLLEQAGYKVITFSDPLAAWEKINAEPTAIDLVISDVTMPKLTGDKLAIKIKEQFPALPVILQTGFNPEVSERSIHELGVKGLLPKPFVRSQLLNMVRTVLDAAHSAEHAAKK